MPSAPHADAACGALYLTRLDKKKASTRPAFSKSGAAFVRVVKTSFTSSNAFTPGSLEDVVTEPRSIPKRRMSPFATSAIPSSCSCVCITLPCFL